MEPAGSVIGPARVGARLEVVTARPVSEPRDWIYLLLLGIVSVVLHGVLIAQSTTCSKDGLGFARYGWSLLHPNHDLPPGETRTQLEILKNNKHHPGFALTAGIVSEIVVSVWEAPFPHQLVLGVQIASLLGALLLVIPAYGIGRLLWNRATGFTAGLLSQVLPVFAKDAADGLSDLTHLALAAWGLMFALRGFRRPRVGQFLMAGLFSGLAYLVRPEGLSVVCATLGVLGLFVLLRIWPLKLSLMLGIALIAGLMITAGPYMFLIGAITNKPSGQRIVSTEEENPRLKQMRENAGIVPPALFARMIPSDAQGLHRVGLVILAILEELAKSTHTVVGVLAVLGVIIHRRDFLVHPERYLLLAYGGVHLVLLLLLGTRTGSVHAVGGYISERHTLPIAFIAILFASGSLKRLIELMPVLPAFRSWTHHPLAGHIGVAIIVLSCVPSLMKPLHPQHAGHLEAGEFLRDRYRIDDHLYDPYEWARFYSGWFTRVIRPDWYRTAGHGRWLLTIVGDRSGPNSSERWQHTQEFLKDPRAVLMFPAAGDPRNEQAGTVQVYWMPFTPEEIAADAAEQRLAEEHDRLNPEAPRRTRSRYGY